MSAWIANLIYAAAYLALLPRIVYRRVVQRRALGNWRQRMLGLVPRRPSERRCLWIHAVSVGEVNQLATLIGPLRERLSDWEIVLSTTTCTGMELAEQKFPGLVKFYFPIDFSWAVGNALRRIKPDVLLLTELEVWPNLIRSAHKRRIPLAVVNGRLSESSFRGYRSFKRLIKSSFARLSLVTAQNEVYARRFVELGCPPGRVHVTGSIKFDIPATHVELSKQRKLRRLAGLRPDDVLLVAGSTQDPEESILANLYRSLKPSYPQLRLAIVPRHPHRGPAIAQQLKQSGLDVLRRSQPCPPSAAPDCIILVDTIGELMDWWSIGTIAFVGGSFGNRGGQNMIEPASVGAAVCFGPNTWNFADVVRMMIEHRVATQVDNDEQLEKFVCACLDHPDWAARRGADARRLVQLQRGAAEGIVGLVCDLAVVNSAKTPRKVA